MPEENNGGGSQGDNKAEALQKALAKHQGDAMALATFLFSDNYDQREKRRQAEAKLPKDGQIVISKEDAALLEAARATNLKPDELKAKVEAASTLETEVATLKRESQLRAVSATGYNFDALKDFDALEPGLEYLVKDEQDKDKKPIKVAYVKKDGAEKPLEEYATEKRPHLLSALREGGTAQTKGTDWATQGGGRKATTDKWQAIRDKKAADEKTKKEQRAASPFAAATA